jgi:predicted RNA-binding protein with PUA-like domain
MTMAHWLFKSEPQTWSWDQQVAKGPKGTDWDGVRNHTAAQNLRAMKVGDTGFFYHSGEERQVMGLVEVIRTARPDPSDETGKFVMVSLKALEPLPKPVTLAAIKAEPKLAGMTLARLPRLSVMPVEPEHFALICRMGGLKRVP